MTAWGPTAAADPAPVNLVGLTTGFHRRLHTNPYYVAVNLTIKRAVRYGRAGIVYALNAIADDLTVRDATFVP